MKELKDLGEWVLIILVIATLAVATNTQVFQKAARNIEASLDADYVETLHDSRG